MERNVQIVNMFKRFNQQNLVADCIRGVRNKKCVDDDALVSNMWNRKKMEELIIVLGNTGDHQIMQRLF